MPREFAMACDYTSEDLSAYVDGELDGPAAERLREHLRVCRDCAGEAAWLSEVAQLVGALPRAEPRQTAAWDLERRAGAAPRRLQCTVALAQALAHFDGELSEEEAADVHAHLFNCAPCYRAYKQLEALAETLQAAEPAPVPAGLEQRIVAAVEAERRAVTRRLVRRVAPYFGWGFRQTVRLAAAAVFLLAVLLGVRELLGPGSVTPGTPPVAPPLVATAPPAERAQPASVRPPEVAFRAPRSARVELPAPPRWRPADWLAAARTVTRPPVEPRVATIIPPPPPPAGRTPVVPFLPPTVTAPPRVPPTPPPAPASSLMASRAPRTGAEVVAPGPPTVMAVAPAPKTAAPEERRSLPSPESPPAPRVAELPSAPVEADSDVEVHAPRSAGWRPVYQPAAALDRERLDAAAGRIDASVDAARRAGTPRLKIPIK